MAILDQHSALVERQKPTAERRGFIPSLLRLFRLRPAKSATFGGMTYEEFVQFAKENPPPQSWWEEDVTGLRGPARAAKTDACQDGVTPPVK